MCKSINLHTSQAEQKHDRKQSEVAIPTITTKTTITKVLKMNQSTFTETFITTSLVELKNKKILNAKTYLETIKNLASELEQTGCDSLRETIAKDMQVSRFDNINIEELQKMDKEDKIADCLLLLLYYPLKHWLAEPAIRYKQVRAKEYAVYIYNGKYWEVITDVIAYARDIIRACGYNYDLALDESVTASIYKAIKKIEHKMKATPHNLLNFSNCTIEFTTNSVITRSHKTDDFFTYVIDKEYNELETCPQFHEYMDKILTKENQDLLFNFVASAFSPEPERINQAMLNIYGKAGAGKSTLIDAITMTLDKAVISMGLDDVINRGIGFSQSDNLELLRGKTIFYAREVGKFGGNNLDATKFKMMMEGTPIPLSSSVNSEQRDPVVCPVIIATSNEAMDLSRVDGGVARRIVYIDIKNYTPKYKIHNLARRLHERNCIGIVNLIIKSYKNIIMSNQIWCNIKMMDSAQWMDFAYLKSYGEVIFDPTEKTLYQYKDTIKIYKPKHDLTEFITKLEKPQPVQYDELAKLFTGFIHRDPNLFMNETTAMMRNDNQVSDNPVQMAIEEALKNDYIRVAPNVFKNECIKAAPFLRELVLLVYPDSKWKVQSGKQISRLLNNCSFKTDMIAGYCFKDTITDELIDDTDCPIYAKEIYTQAYHANTRVINLYYTEKGKEWRKKMFEELQHEKLKEAYVTEMLVK